MPRIFPIGGTDSGTSASGDASTDAPTADSGDAVVSDNSGSAADQTPQGAFFPFMMPNPPMKDRTQAVLGCEMSGMAGPDACNSLKTGSMFKPSVCGWNVKKGKCEQIELGKGNLCKTVADQETCNQQGDCCWDMKGYCGEYDFGDCLRPMPNMANLMPNMGGMANMAEMEKHMEAQSEMAEAKTEMAEAKAEMAENHAEIMGEMQSMQMGPGGMAMEQEVEYEDLPFVKSCTGLQQCFGREGMSPCILNAQKNCVKMNMPTMPNF